MVRWELGTSCCILLENQEVEGRMVFVRDLGRGGRELFNGTDFKLSNMKCLEMDGDGCTTV